MTTIEEELADHTWDCEECPGIVYSKGFLINKEVGVCDKCGLEQERPEESDG